jgi:DNA invertase Pin-like site-specific DNA recombinase
MAENKEEYEFGKDCILIARVSTPKQVLEEGASPQMSALRKYATDLGYNDKTFKEINSVESGFLESDTKIGWNLVTDWIEKHPSYRTIVCVEMSRLSRRKKVLFHIQDYLITHKVQLIIKDIDFQLFNKYGEVDLGKDIIFSLYASLAESEMRQKNERKKNALLDYTKKGISIGGKKLFGYKRELADGEYGKKGKKKYVKDDIQADQIVQVFNMYAYGIDNDLTKTSTATIALECRKRGYDKYLHSKRNVQNLLKNEAYTGFKVTHNKIRNKEYFNYHNEDAAKYIDGTSFECMYPRIIEDWLFQIVKERLETENPHKEKGTDGQTKDKSSKHVNILAKILRCRFCGSYFIADYRVDKNGLPKFTYRDGGARAKKELRKCEHGQTVSMKMLDSAIWAFVKGMVADITLKQREAKSESNILNVKQQIENLMKGYDEIEIRLKTEEKIFRMSAKLKNNYDKAEKDYENKIKEIENERRQIDKEIASKNRQLKFLQNSSNTDLDKAISSNIDLIESSKAEISKYVHLLVKEALILENNMPYTVLQITSVNNIDEIFNYAEDNSIGLPKIIKEKNDGRYYMLIHKDYHGNYSARVITDQSCKWNDESQVFMLGDYRFDVPFIFGIDIYEQDPSKWCGLTNGLKILEIKTLDLYDEDLTESMIMKKKDKTIVTTTVFLDDKE